MLGRTPVISSSANDAASGRVLRRRALPSSSRVVSVMSRGRFTGTSATDTSPSRRVKICSTASSPRNVEGASLRCHSASITLPATHQTRPCPWSDSTVTIASHCVNSMRCSCSRSKARSISRVRSSVALNAVPSLATGGREAAGADASWAAGLLVPSPRYDDARVLGAGGGVLRGGVARSGSATGSSARALSAFAASRAGSPDPSSPSHLDLGVVIPSKFSEDWEGTLEPEPAHP
jgi:hypothetical protein